MTTAAEKAAFEFLPPALSGEQKVVTVSVTSSAAEVDVFTHLTSGDAPGDVPTYAKRNWCQLTVKANGGEAFIAFKSASSAQTVTNTTGFVLNDGDERSFWVNRDLHSWMEHISDATATLFVYVSSKPY